jgi:hypothetical protein
MTNRKGSDPDAVKRLDLRSCRRIRGNAKKAASVQGR